MTGKQPGLSSVKYIFYFNHFSQGNLIHWIRTVDVVEQQSDMFVLFMERLACAACAHS